MQQFAAVVLNQSRSQHAISPSSTPSVKLVEVPIFEVIIREICFVRFGMRTMCIFSEIINIPTRFIPSKQQNLIEN